jgi:folate-dependent phosphoribosylglycinamide formyltransferase PurN
MNNPIVLLATDCQATRLVYHALTKEYSIVGVILEQRCTRWRIIKGRIGKLGLIVTTGQVLFQAMIVPLLRAAAVKRTRAILQIHGYEDRFIPPEKIIAVSSVNSPECREVLQALLPDVVVVSGTRIISSETLQCVAAPFINTHAGITPQYRGSHGAYWALWNNDPQNCGVTVHFVDRGIDTGAVLYQSRIDVTKADNFTTYPTQQICVGIDLLKAAIGDIIRKKDRVKEKTLKGMLWYHPTLWGYLWARLARNVK